MKTQLKSTQTLALLLVMLLSFGCAVAQSGEQTSEYDVLQNRPDRRIVRLPNRMVVIAQNLPTAPVVSAQVWVKTGSIYEQEFIGAGLSHFLEHLVSGGSTTTRTEEESNEILGQIGARTNAATGLDNVHYYIDTTSDHAGEAIALLTDWMRNSKIEQGEYEREQQVIQREFENGLGSPGRIFWKLTQQARFVAHPARHPTIGYLSDFMQVSRDQIYAFYKRMYVPNNMIFVVAGNIDPQKTVDYVASLWNDAPTGKLPDVKFPQEPEVLSPRSVTGIASISQPKLRLAWPGTQLAEDGDYALDLLAGVLGQGESSRLVQSVRDEKRLANTISAYNLSFTWGKGFVGIDADIAVKPGQEVDEAIGLAKEAILHEVARIRNEGVTEEELARAKRKVRASVAYDGQNANGVASRLASDVIGMGDPDYMQKYAEKVQSISASKVQFVATKYLDVDKMITITLMPPPPGERPVAIDRDPNEIIPDGLEYEQVILDNAVVLDKLDANIKPGETEVKPIKLDPMQTYELDNGMTLLVQRSTLVPAVSVQMYHLGGLLGDDAGQEGVTNAMVNMLMKGTKSQSAAQIAAKIEDLGARFGYSCGNNTFYARGICLREDVGTILELMQDTLVNPSFPEDEWAKMQPRMVAAIQRSTDSWPGELQTRFREAYYGEDHPWSQLTLGRASVVESLTPADLKAFHSKRLNMAHAVIAVFGDVDPDAIASQVKALFANAPADKSVAFEPPQPPAIKTGRHVYHTEKNLAAVQIGAGPGVTRDHPDYPALNVLSKVFSSFPSGWLVRELRGDGAGLAYAVWSYPLTGVIPGYTVVAFNTQPAVADQAVERAQAVIDRAKNEVVDEKTLGRAKAAVLVGEFLGKQSNGDRATEAALNKLYGLPENESEVFFEAVNTLTAEQLQEIAKRRLAEAVTVIITDKSVADAEQPKEATQPTGE